MKEIWKVENEWAALRCLCQSFPNYLSGLFLPGAFPLLFLSCQLLSVFWGALTFLWGAWQVAQCFGQLCYWNTFRRCCLKTWPEFIWVVVGGLENKQGQQLFQVWCVRLDNIIPFNCFLNIPAWLKQSSLLAWDADAELKICCPELLSVLQGEWGSTFLMCPLPPVAQGEAHLCSSFPSCYKYILYYWLFANIKVNAVCKMLE